jgi:hypothetical protein
MPEYNDTTLCKWAANHAVNSRNAPNASTLKQIDFFECQPQTTENLIRRIIY